MKEETVKHDLLIVGCGLLGNITALLAANAGLSVVVVEQKALSDLLLAKSARIDEEVILMLEQLGLMEQLKEVLHPLEGNQIVDKKGRILLEFNQDSYSQWAPLWGFYQPKLQLILQKEALKHPNIEIWEETSLEAFEQTEEGVQLYVAQQKMVFKELQAAYLLVCNGQNSALADLLDIEAQYFNCRQAVLCVDTYTKNAAATSQHHAQTIYDTSLPVTRITKRKQYQRWEFQLPAADNPLVDQPAEIRALISDLSANDWEIEATFVYDVEAKILKQWQSEQVFILGDAAHMLPPYLGMGLAAGLKDAYNLIWKLQWVLQRRTSSRLLKTYQLEREPDVRHQIQLNLWTKRLFQSSKLRWIKNFIPFIPKSFLKRQLNTSYHIKYGLIGQGKRAGYLLHSGLVATTKGTFEYLNAALDYNFVVLALGQNPVDALSPTALEFFATLQAQFVEIVPQQQAFRKDTRYSTKLYDKKGQLQVWLATHQAKFVLLRPDRMVYAFCANRKALHQNIQLLQRQLLRGLG